MTIASDLLQRHVQTLVEDNAQWQTLIADDILWELAYAPAIGHPPRLSGREEVVRHTLPGVVWDPAGCALWRDPSPHERLHRNGKTSISSEGISPGPYVSLLD